MFIGDYTPVLVFDSQSCAERRVHSLLSARVKRPLDSSDTFSVPLNAVEIGWEVCFLRLTHRRGGHLATADSSHKATFTTVPDEPRNDRVQHDTDFAKDVQWHGLSRPRRPPSGPGEVLGAGLHGRALYRARSRIELPRPEFLAVLVGVGFSLSRFLWRFRLCPLAGLGFGHVFIAFPLRQPVSANETACSSGKQDLMIGLPRRFTAFEPC